MSLLKRGLRAGIKVLGSGLKATPAGRVVTTAAAALKPLGKRLAPIMPGVGTVASVALPAVATIGAGRLAKRAEPRAAGVGRRRTKGISGSEMKAFNRVTRILDKVCKTPAPVRRRSASRSKSCR